MRYGVALPLTLLTLVTASAALAQPVDNWVAIGKSGAQTILLQRTAATIYANGERRAWVKSELTQPQTIEGLTFVSTLTYLVYDCAHNQAKIVDTRFLDASGGTVYQDTDADVPFLPIVADSETAFVKGFVCAAPPRANNAK